MVTAILKTVEMTLLKYLTKGKKSFPKTMHLMTNTIILHVINCPFIFKTLITMISCVCVNTHFLINITISIHRFLITEPSGVFAHLRVQWLISQLTKILLN